MNQTQALITDSNKTPLVQIFVWIPLVIASLSVFARLATKLGVLKKLELQDYLITISLLFAIGQSVAVAIQCANGFGQFITTLSRNDEETMLKAEYASSPLFIASLCFAKMSTVVFFHSLTPISSERRVSQSLGLIILLWTVSSIVTTLFQCHLPLVWDTIHGICFNRVAFWNYVSAMNIITDAGLILIITVIALHIQVSWNRKATIIVVFGTRIFVIAAVAVQMYYMNKPVHDPAFDPWPASISIQIVQCLSIVTACFPYLKPFLASLESGLMRADDLRRRGDTTIDAYNIYNSGESGSRGTGKKSKGGKFLSGTTQSHELSSIAAPDPVAHPDGTATVVTGDEHGWDGLSQTSESRIIRETRTWNIDVQNDGHRREPSSASE
ncbi:integral membrane protein [Rutstroemia sp. NJR-2017a BBW]|nr:integral membrane protein [Rutstroemia sp. NJR-2017a BBW]